nr:immunoglobulin heavy chain junction region [Macaca mulatta]MOY21697.1 immunoglobulin heavy chain junction region [Macaca mulatta]
CARVGSGYSGYNYEWGLDSW